MGDDLSYELPTETLPSLGLANYLDDLKELTELLEGRGLKTANTRIERYIKYLEQSLTDCRGDATAIFKNAQDARFKSPMDWALYVMRETHELSWIAKGLKAHLPQGVDEKLKIIVAGRDFAALDLDSSSRNAQFELRVASYFCQVGCEVVLSLGTDIVAMTDREAFYIECKRIGGAAQVAKRLNEARKQLRTRMPKKVGNRAAFGCVAADVTKVAFSHNGITMGVTNAHSRDVIQKELIRIAQDAERLDLFKDCSSLLTYWFQIHIPALILQPQTVVTRFSSYHVARSALDRRQARALGAFYKLFEAASNVPDPRAHPPQNLKPRTSYEFPAGTTFTLSEDFEQILGRHPSPAGDESQFIGELTVRGLPHTFTVFDLRFVPLEVLHQCRDLARADLGQAGMSLLAEMFVQRFPYEP
jgi:hypothetical protein